MISKKADFFLKGFAILTGLYAVSIYYIHLHPFQCSKESLNIAKEEVVEEVASFEEPALFEPLEESCPPIESKNPDLTLQPLHPEIVPLPREALEDLLAPPSFSTAKLAESPTSLLLKKPLLPPSKNYLPLSSEVVDLSDCFQVETHIIRDEKNKDYLFSISLKPREQLQSYDSKQRLIFLIDRSSSLTADHFALYAKGLMKSLSLLKSECKIALFNRTSKTLSIFTPQNTPEGKKETESFLSGAKIGEEIPVETSLNCLNYLAKDLKADEFCTFFFISEGHSLAKTSHEREDLNKWLKTQSGKCSLYTATAGLGNNLPLLQLVAQMGRGKLIYSDTYAGFPQRLAAAARAVRMPLASDVRFKVLGAQEMPILFFSKEQRASPLYYDTPYQIFGRCHDPKEFTLLLEAQHGEQTLYYKTLVKFSKVEKNNPSLKARIAFEKGASLFESFLESGDKSQLTEATELLKPFLHEGYTIK